VSRDRRAWSLFLLAFALTVPTVHPIAAGLADPSATEPEATTGPLPLPPATVDVYKGLGTWVDMYDAPPWRYPARAVHKMSAKGVKTLYLETANYRKPKTGPIFRAAKVTRFLAAAEEAGISVVAWYVPGFDNLRRDFRRARAAIEFQTEEGLTFDSFALDIEATLVRDIETRNRRARRLSRRIRDLVGEDYVLGAIVPEAGALYWPSFPYRGLAYNHDVFLPMAYFSYRTSGARGVYAFVADNITAVREATGKPNIPVHLIGGIAEDSTPREVGAMVQASRDHASFGSSLYDFPTTTRRQWRKLAEVP